MGLRDSFVSKGLEPLHSILDHAVLPSLYLFPGDPGEPPVTRLGGRPNLPPELAWPEWQSEPLAFIAQLDLDTLPKLENLPLPDHGALFFFYAGSEKAWGGTPESVGCTRVLYSATPLASAQLRDFPQQLPPHLAFTGIALDPILRGHSLPDRYDQTLEELELGDEIAEAYEDWLAAWRAEVPTWHRMGGYPDPIQEDPKLEIQLFTHGLLGDSDGYKKAKELGLYPGARDWQLLLQVDSEEDAGMMWGDVGILYFLIHPQDLASRNFENVQFVLQCC